jgi:hypothetical protein
VEFSFDFRSYTYTVFILVTLLPILSLLYFQDLRPFVVILLVLILLFNLFSETTDAKRESPTPIIFENLIFEMPSSHAAKASDDRLIYTILPPPCEVW